MSHMKERHKSFQKLLQDRFILEYYESTDSYLTFSKTLAKAGTFDHAQKKRFLVP